MICLGIDPDLHNTAIALINGDYEVLDLAIASIPSKYTGIEAKLKMMEILENIIGLAMSPYDDIDLCVVEGQQKYFGTSAARTKDLIDLAHVSGAAAAYCISFNPERISMPVPATWKGSIPKPIHQERILKRLKWSPKRTATYAYPTTPPAAYLDFTKTHWKHLVDAIGLAIWGYETFSIQEMLED